MAPANGSISDWRSHQIVMPEQRLALRGSLPADRSKDAKAVCVGCALCMSPNQRARDERRDVPRHHVWIPDAV